MSTVAGELSSGHRVSRARFAASAAALVGGSCAAIAQTTRASAAATSATSAVKLSLSPDAATDPRLDPQVRAFLAVLDKDTSPFWELPGPQVRATLTGLQQQTPVDMSGVNISDVTIGDGAKRVKLYIVKPANATGSLPVILFIHGGVWIAGDFENHKRLVRDLVVGTGAAVVFPEYTPIPDAIFPTQLEQCYGAATWAVASGKEYGLDGKRMVVAGNSVGGNMAAALAIMTKDRGGPALRLQVLMIPATDTNFDSDSYSEFATGRFLARAFMQFGWNIYAPDDKTRSNAYAVPMCATVAQLQGLPPALVITAENCPLRDEGEAYARKLKEAGVRVAATRYNGTIHDFVLLNAIRDVPSTQAASFNVSAAIRQSLIA